MACITINGVSIEVAADTTILQAAKTLGITIPTLCHHDDLTPVGSCRMCLCEIEGTKRPTTACDTLCRDGMRVKTDTPQLRTERRMILEMLLENFRDADFLAPNRKSTEFLELVDQYHAEHPAPSAPPHYAIDSDENPFIRVDLNKCILCSRCIRACNDVQGRFVWHVAERGNDTRIVSGNDTSMLDARCESCGACAAYCPTGALEDRLSNQYGHPDRVVRTTCGYCGVGCQFDLNVCGERIVQVTSSPSAPVNGMSLCVKGRYGYDFIHHPERLTRPRVRKYLLDGKSIDSRPADRGAWVEVDWSVALDFVADRFSEIQRKSGGHSFGVLSSAKCTNEENYLMQKFARQILRTNNVDHCARLCHSSTVAGLAMAMGSGAMSNSMADIAHHSSVIFIIGSNTTEQHPVFGAMLRQAALRGTKIIVADPRLIDIVEFASIYLRHRAGTDIALINGIMNLAIEHGWQDQSFIHDRCEGYEEFASAVAKYTPESVSQITGVSTSDLYAAAELLCTSKPMAVIWAMGITQHTTGVSNVLSLANLQMLLGNIGVPGGGVNPLRGQNNVQGACDMGALPNVFPGYQRVDDAAINARFCDDWRLASESGEFLLDAFPGLTVTEMLEAANRRDIRALYLLGEDPAMTEPDCNHACKCLANAELIVLQEIFESETAKFADVLLPGCTFAEKSGTFTNTERRVQPVREAISPSGESRPDWQITADLANRLMDHMQLRPQGPWARWDYESASDALREINAVTSSYAGLTPERIENGEQLQWPVPDAQHAGTPILHVGEFARGKGKFHVTEHLSAAELPNAEFPLLLTTGRVLYHWHGGEMTRRSERLLKICPEPTVEISIEDSRRYSIPNDAWVVVRSRRGELRARAMLTNRVAAGTVFANFHFPGSGNANNLTINVVDPVAKIPEYKVCAVTIVQA